MLLKKNWHFTAGYGEQQVLEIIRFVSKVISNYTNHIANTPVDGASKIRLKIINKKRVTNCNLIIWQSALRSFFCLAAPQKKSPLSSLYRKKLQLGCDLFYKL
jgi:hypothetical protein